MRAYGPILLLFGLVGCSSPARTQPLTDPLLHSLPADCNQAIIVRPIRGKKVDVSVQAYERESGGPWNEVFPPMAGSVGRNGIASAENKKEGDGCTPAGTYPIGPAFGYAKTIDTKLPYRQATDKDFWVDDDQSPDYNRWVVGKPAARSFEMMKRADDLYEIGAVIRYNTDPVIPGKGSAIFLHVWSGPGKPTAGCVALEKDHVRMLLRWLKDEAKPRIAIAEG
ncbi:MAG TPA: L,D-transpeptidase family protein [Fimbriiglobus sp.]|jgi:L,D-peptidoglycan transpeptidase YkuD (ErfK/YbiS/YcfS/YnhG family)